MEKSLNILLIEDNPGDARIVQEYLNEETSIKFNLYHAVSLSEGLNILSVNPIDIILSDLGLPDSQGIDTFSRLAKTFSTFPIILFTGQYDNELGLKVVKMGADDYLIKGQINQQILIRSIKYAIERKKAKNAQELTFRILHILNSPTDWQQLLNDILTEIQIYSGIEAVAIRIQNKEDYPYFTTIGFGTAFLHSEHSLCIKDLMGNDIKDKEGKPALACMCGNIIKKRTNPEYNYFSHFGSFWTNGTTELLASITEEERQAFSRNICNKSGYESVALIPVISEKETIGLLQFNDKRTNMFTGEIISFFEEIASTIGIAYTRVQNKEQLKVSEERLKVVAESAGEWVWEVNKEGLYTYSNDMVETLLGYKAEEIVGKKHFYDLFQHESKEALKEAAFTVFNQNLTFKDFENPNIHKDGHEVILKTSGCPILDQDQNLIGYLGADIDITDLKKYEKELISTKERAEESDRLKSAFLANISHEIRTPMNGIMGFAELLKEPRLSGEEQQEYIHFIEKSGLRMLNIMNDLISISKIHSGQLELNITDTNIKEQFESIYTQFLPDAVNKGIKLSYHDYLPAHKSIVKTDSEILSSILINLVKNAIKYTEKGTIEIGYTFKNEKDPEEYLFFVKDTGIGISSERHEAIFDRFVQADVADIKASQGAGLGLAITKAYVEKLGGKIWIESKIDNGSAFYFTLPYKKEEHFIHSKNHSVMSNTQKSHFSSQTALIVEDDELSTILLESILSKQFQKLLYARTGIEAVEMSRNNPDIVLIMMDIKMPDMDGFEATRQIRQFNHNVIIIAQSAYSLREDRDKAVKAGCNAYISKPYNTISIQKVINSVLKYETD